MIHRVFTQMIRVSAILLLSWGGTLAAQTSSVTSAPGVNLSAFVPAPFATESSDLVSPRGAFLRSLLVPGWGQMASGAPTRGAFFIGAQGGSYWMLGKTLLRQRQAIRFRDITERAVQAEFRDLGVQLPDSLSLLASQDLRVIQRDSLVTMRGDQVEDWIALSIFVTFLSATDALVSSHMSRFPEPLGMTPSARRRSDGVWEVGLQIPMP